MLARRNSSSWTMLPRKCERNVSKRSGRHFRSRSWIRSKVLSQTVHTVLSVSGKPRNWSCCRRSSLCLLKSSKYCARAVSRAVSRAVPRAISYSIYAPAKSTASARYPSFLAILSQSVWTYEGMELDSRLRCWRRTALASRDSIISTRSFSYLVKGLLARLSWLVIITLPRPAWGTSVLSSVSKSSALSNTTKNLLFGLFRASSHRLTIWIGRKSARSVPVLWVESTGIKCISSAHLTKLERTASGSLASTHRTGS